VAFLSDLRVLCGEGLFDPTSKIRIVSGNQTYSDVFFTSGEFASILRE
jgi:hypothetical protein